MTKTFHVGVAVRYLLLMDDAELSRMLVNSETGRNIPAPEARELLKEMRAKGVTVVPPCDHTDATGRCLGHEYGDDRTRP